MEITRIDEILDRKAEELKTNETMQDIISGGIMQQTAPNAKLKEQTEKIDELTKKVKSYKVATFAVSCMAFVAIVTLVIIILKRK